MHTSNEPGICKRDRPWRKQSCVWIERIVHRARGPRVREFLRVGDAVLILRLDARPNTKPRTVTAKQQERVNLETRETRGRCTTMMKVETVKEGGKTRIEGVARRRLCQERKKIEKTNKRRKRSESRPIRKHDPRQLGEQEAFEHKMTHFPGAGQALRQEQRNQEGLSPNGFTWTPCSWVTRKREARWCSWSQERG